MNKIKRDIKLFWYIFLANRSLKNLYSICKNINQNLKRWDGVTYWGKYGLVHAHIVYAI